MGPGSRSLSRRQVRELDRLAIQQWQVPGVVLMENAGRGAADAIERYLGGLSGKKVAVVAGRGNNGGDGFVIARHLHIRGSEVRVFVVADAAKIGGDAAVNLQIARTLGLDIRACTGVELAGLAGQLAGADLVVDALGGTGIAGPLRGDLAVAVEAINAAGRPVVAVDIPTGLDCDTGLADGPAVRAVMTVTFVARKIGFDTPASAAYTGEVIVADIGVPPPPADA